MKRCLNQENVRVNVTSVTAPQEPQFCRLRRVLAMTLLALAVLPAWFTLPAAAQSAPGFDSATMTRIEAALDSVVQVKATAVDNARSTRTLGRAREGSGVVLAPSGLVLTIGYLILEAESVEIITNGGKKIPGTVAGYDHATGFGLVRPLVPLGLTGVELGVSSTIAEQERVVFATFGGRNNANLAQVVSKRRFAGYWEYLIDDALFTIPPRPDHQGAALIDRNGKLIGVGSLLVADALVPQRRFPGNMFVPVDLLRPILEELSANRPTKDSQRPWIGLNANDLEGRISVMRVTEEAPAAQAGLRAGDIILSVGSDKVTTLESFWTALWSQGKSGVTVKLKVLQGVDVKDIEVKSVDRLDFIRKKSVL